MCSIDLSMRSTFLNLKQLHRGVVPNWWPSIAKIDDTPHVGAKPDGGADVGLVFANQNRVRHGQQAHQCAVLQEAKNFVLVGDAFVEAHFFDLRHQYLEKRNISKYSKYR